MQKLSSREIKKYLSDASTFVQKGRLQDAELALRTILQSFPSHPDALTNLATTCFMQNKIEEAINYTKKSLEINPYQSDALNNCALGLRTLGRLDEALYMSKESIRIQLTNIDAYITASLILSEMNEDSEALIYLDKALEIRNLKTDPETLAMILNNRANIFVKKKQYSLALDDLSKALVLKPNLSEALRNRAIALKGIGSYQEALECLKEIIQLDGNLIPEAYHLKGLVYDKLSQYNLSIEMYNKALKIKPNFFEAIHSRGHALLRLENFTDGWEDYEYRLFESDHELNKEILNIESWTTINQKDDILILKEQGIGDHIFFGGFLNEFQKKCNSLTVEIDRRLIPLFQRSFQKIKFIEKRSELENEYLYKKIPLGSIAKFLRRSLDDFKNTEEKYLKADELKTNEVRKNIQFKHKLKIGISWRSKGKDTGDIRTLSFDRFIKLFDSNNISLINLQYGNIENDIASIDCGENYEFINYNEIDNYKDIDGLACLIEICDIVITVDNITAHLAGALGKKTWVLLPTYSDFRWMLNSSECLWYKNTTLFRQETLNDWNPVIQKIKTALENFTQSLN